MSQKLLHLRQERNDQTRHILSQEKTKYHQIYNELRHGSAYLSKEFDKRM